MDLQWPLSDGRVSVRPVLDSDTEAVLAYRRRPESRAYVGRTIDTMEQARAWLAEIGSREDALLCAVLVDAEVVGDIGGRLVRPDTLGPEPGVLDFVLGYTVGPEHRGRGIASAAVGLLVAALHRAGVRRVVAEVVAENEASVRVLLRNGFRLEATRHRAVLGRDGRWLDDCTLAHLDGVDVVDSEHADHGPSLVEVRNGDARDALALSSLMAESYCLAVVKAGDRRVAVCDWQGERLALLLPRFLLDHDASIAGAVAYSMLITPDVVPAPDQLLRLFQDPVLAGCRPLVHEDEPTGP